MQIRVDKDNLRIIKLSQLESGEVDVTEVNFIFTPEYKDLIKTAVFTLGDKSYKVILQNDKCYIPTEVLVEGNKITIGVYAFKQDSEELILRYSPVPVTAEILKGSYVEEAENTSHPTPTEIEQLMELISKNTSDIESLDNRVTTLENKEGSCETQIENIKEDLIDIKSDIDDIEDDITSIRSDITNINENIDTIEGNISDLNDDISDINTEITRINNVDERQNRRLNGIDNFIRQWPKTDYQTGTSINLGKTIQATVQYEDDKVLYGDTSQEGTPTPTEPIPIQVVTGTQEVVVRGKNELPNKRGASRTVNGIALTNNNNGSITLNGTSTAYTSFLDTENFIIKAGTYTLSITGITDNSLLAGQIRSTDGQNVYISTSTEQSRTYTFDEDTEVRYRTVVYANKVIDEITIYPMLESGSTATSYEPYITPTTYQVHLGNLELAKIGTYQDYIYFDIDEGKWYKKKAIEKISSYNGETITTDYISTTGQLTIGATIYYIVTATDEEITDTTLIADLDNLLPMMSVEGTTIIEVSGILPGSLKVKAYAQLQAAT